MGCQLGKLLRSLGFGRGEEAEEEETAPKVYSWDKREKISKENFILDQRLDEEIGRMPGSVNGEQFIIQNCTNCDIYVFDHCAAVTIDDCTNCRIFIGAVKSSVFIRDCVECCVVTSCQQFRTRDCKKIKAFLCCVTKPIIEATTGIKFGCLQYHYPDMMDHMTAASLSIFNNNWYQIHDFTPVPGENNYTFMENADAIQKYMQCPLKEPWNTIPVSLDAKDSFVPFTMGTDHRPPQPTCLISVFHSTKQKDVAKRILSVLSPAPVIQTLEVTLDERRAQQLFDSTYSQLVCRSKFIICLSLFLL